MGISLDGRKVRVRWHKRKQMYTYTGGQRKPNLFDLLALTYLNRDKTPGFREMYDHVLIRTEIELRVELDDPQADVEDWLRRRLVIDGRSPNSAPAPRDRPGGENW
jgi:hypothetical protein